jgi:hypothetical protein
MELHHPIPSKSHAETLIFKVALFKDRAFKEVINISYNHEDGVLLQDDRCLYQMRKHKHREKAK